MQPARAGFGLAAAACFGAIAWAILWLQQGLGLEPCPLCVLDRVAFALAGVVLLLAALHGPARTGRRVYAALALLPLAFGLAVAGRHVWLQHLPEEQVPACGPSLDYILENFPLQRALDLVLRGSGSCAQVQWRFLGLSIPEWTLALFALLALFAVAVIVRPGRD
ncbi:MAG: disulfide bond formation protein B [Halofilum sp. (in: g-proteobacteria)]|nr:disulfide bond formation protein B [Halofilum sp. (in: g-proteobacteria)]